MHSAHVVPRSGAELHGSGVAVEEPRGPGGAPLCPSGAGVGRTAKCHGPRHPGPAADRRGHRRPRFDRVGFFPPPKEKTEGLILPRPTGVGGHACRGWGSPSPLSGTSPPPVPQIVMHDLKFQPYKIQCVINKETGAVRTGMRLQAIPRVPLGSPPPPRR